MGLQQTGFVKDRYITDNLIVVKLAQEHANLMQQDIILLKLDFEKAFDCVDHSFLWATLHVMNLNPHVLTLIQGLITNVEAKVHVNGFFTRLPLGMWCPPRRSSSSYLICFVCSTSHEALRQIQQQW